MVGASGSGKSTFINLILENLKNYEGHIMFNKHEIRDMNENEIIR